MNKSWFGIWALKNDFPSVMTINNDDREIRLAFFSARQIEASVLESPAFLLNSQVTFSCMNVSWEKSGVSVCKFFCSGTPLSPLVLTSQKYLSRYFPPVFPSYSELLKSSISTSGIYLRKSLGKLLPLSRTMFQNGSCRKGNLPKMAKKCGEPYFVPLFTTAI